VNVGELVEGALEVVEALLGDQRGVGRTLEPDQPGAVGRPQPLIGVHRHLDRVAVAPVRVDRRVAGDLVDPRLEVDLGVRLAHAAQRREERLLRHVLAAGGVVQHRADEPRDARLVAPVKLLEGGVVTGPNRSDEFGVGGLATSCGDQLSIPAEKNA
jgi:hypothetical protein